VAEKTHYERLSFAYDILPWLKECLEETPKEFRARDNITQLIEAVELFCGRMEDAKMNEEILEMITKSPDMVKAAEAIRSVSDFDNRSLNTFRGPVLVLVKKTYPKARYLTENLGDVIWKYLEFPIREGRYLFQVNYDWRAVWVNSSNGKEGKSPEGAALHKKMGELFKAEAWSDDRSAWASEDTSWPSLASCKDDRTLYLAHLSKLPPQEAADRIIAIARTLESVKAEG
jgi:predicted DNA-binding protein